MTDTNNVRRILFVDDEPRVLEGLENMLFSFMDEWEMEFVESGKEALIALEKKSFAVVISDMCMPGMDGATLLQHVKERHPACVRIVLSGHAELEAALRVMPVAHQFLSKPCDAARLVDVLRRACSLQKIVDDEGVRRVIGTLKELPARPQIYHRLTSLLADERAALSDVAALIEQDIGISTKILHLVNTAFFSRGNVVTSMQQAVPRLGAVFVKNLVLAVEVFQEFSGRGPSSFSIDALHEHSFLTGSIAKALLVDREQAESAFLAGVLHDVGQLILVTEFAEVWAEAQKQSTNAKPKFVVEEEELGVTHAEVGAYLLGLWGLPFPIMEAVANHHQPQRFGADSLDISTAVYIANLLADEVESGCESNFDFAFLERIGVADRVQHWRELAANIYEGIQGAPEDSDSGLVTELPHEVRPIEKEWR